MLLGRGNDEPRAPILRPAGFRLLFAHGDFFAVANRRHAVRGYAESNEIIHRRLGAFGAERHVIIRRAPFVAMSFDLQSRRGVGLQPIGVVSQTRACVI